MKIARIAAENISNYQALITDIGAIMGHNTAFTEPTPF